MLYTKIQPQSFLSSVEDVFTIYMDMAAILFTGTDPFDQIVNILSTEGLMWNLMRIVQVV